MQRDLRDIQKSLIQGERFDKVGDLAVNRKYLAGHRFVFSHLTADYGEMRAALERLSHRHGRVNAKLAGGIVTGSDHPALLNTATDGNGNIPQRGVITHFHRREKTVTVAVNNLAHWLPF